jgi:hypothetical protein
MDRRARGGFGRDEGGGGVWDFGVGGGELGFFLLVSAFVVLKAGLMKEESWNGHRIFVFREAVLRYLGVS